MKKYVSYKYRLISLILLGVFLFSAVSLCVVRIVESSQNKEQPHHIKVSAADLTIYDFAGLKSFAESVNEGNNYSGKVVELGSSIDCLYRDSVGIYLKGNLLSIGGGSVKNYGQSVVPFAGTFDGKGYTISNFIVKDYFNYADVRDTGAGNIYGCGFFAALQPGAIVKNLRLKDYRIESGLDYDNYAPTYSGTAIGGIAGFISSGGSGIATITNCAVENLTIDCNSSDIKRINAIGGIVGGNPHVGGSISNCLVNKISFIGSGNDFWNCNIAGIVGNDPAVEEDSVKVSCCVVNKSNWSYSSSGSGSTIKDFTAQATKNCHTTANTTTGLNCNSVGGEYDATATDGTQTLWYYGADDYNNGYPYLRMFIEDWTYIQIQNVYKKINLKLDNVEQESHIDLLVPPEVKTFPSTTTSTILNICNRTIEAFSLNPNRYRVAGFTFISSPFPRYLSRYEDITNNLTFNWCDNATMALNGTEVTETQVLKLFGDEEITVTYTELSKEGTYSIITFTITDPLEKTTRTVIYTANALYCLTGQNLTTETEITLSGDKTVTVTCVEKTYTPNFG